MGKDKKGWKIYGTIFLVTLLLVLVIRSFLIQSYTVSSSQMETALLKGDRVLVDKTAYGIRMPVTLLSLPFTFDTFLGIRSYLDFIHLGYKRLFSSKVKKNDIVLFNNPLETDKPIDKRSLILSRCVAVPGDTIHVRGNDFYINNKKYIPSPDFLMTFKFPANKKDSIVSIMESFDIPFRMVSSTDSVWELASLNRYESFILNQKLPSSIELKEDIKSDLYYELIVPSKGSEVKFNDLTASLYNKIVQQEDKDIIFKGNYFFKNDMLLDSYRFTDDYYWFVSDNPDGSTDSRSLGFISEKFVIGKAFYIWFNSYDGKINWDRCFSAVE